MKKVALAAASLFLSTSSFAGSFAMPGYEAYLEGQIGGSHYNIDDHAFSPSIGSNALAFAFRLGVLKPIQPKVSAGLEAGVDFLRDATVGTLSISQTVPDVLAVLDYAVDENITLFAKAGVAFVQQYYKDNTIALSGNNSDVRAKVVVGGGCALTKNLSVTANVSHINGVTYRGALPIAQTKSLTTTTGMVGLRYTV